MRFSRFLDWKWIGVDRKWIGNGSEWIEMGRCTGAVLKPNQSCPPSSGPPSAPPSCGMTTTHPKPETATPARAPADEVVGDVVQALVPAPRPLGDAAPIFSAPIPQLPVQLGVSIPVREFRVRQLLALAPGQVIETRWSHGDDLPLAAGELQLAWSEFEVVETRLAVRVTRLA